MSIDCKKCKYATVLFTRDREDRHTTTYSPFGRVCCSGPRYGGRSFIVRDQRKACEDYEQKEKPER